MMMQIPAVLGVPEEHVEIQTVPLTEKILISELNNGLDRVVGGKAILKEVQNRRRSGTVALGISHPCIIDFGCDSHSARAFPKSEPLVVNDSHRCGTIWIAHVP